MHCFMSPGQGWEIAVLLRLHVYYFWGWHRGKKWPLILTKGMYSSRDTGKSEA